jgi:hypothetical protein
MLESGKTNDERPADYTYSWTITPVSSQFKAVLEKAQQ